MATAESPGGVTGLVPAKATWCVPAMPGVGDCNSGSSFSHSTASIERWSVRVRQIATCSFDPCRGHVTGYNALLKKRLARPRSEQTRHTEKLR